MNSSLSKEFGLVDGQTYIIGRKGSVSMEGHIYINSSTVSRPHVAMKIKNGRVHLRDLDSTNGIYVLENDVLVGFHEGYVKPNQTIVIGKVKCTIASLLAISGVYTDSKSNSADFEETQRIDVPVQRRVKKHVPFKSWM